MAGTPGNGDSSTRKWLALGIVGVSIIGVVTISAVAILAAGDAREDMSQLVFSSVLPLLGTWVGTVLAFYFARDNLEAATQSTLRLTGRGETATPVTKVMIREADFIAYDLAATEAAEDLKLSELHARMSAMTPPARRLPIRDSAGAVLYVVHDSTLTAYAESEAETTATLTKTLGDLLGKPEYKELVEAIGFVAKDATVADARRVMVSIKQCNDVFATESGKPDERAIGWLTNTLLAGVQ